MISSISPEHEYSNALSGELKSTTIFSAGNILIPVVITSEKIISDERIVS